MDSASAWSVAPNAPVLVAGGALLGATAGGVAGTTAGVLGSQGVPPFVLAARLAKSWFLFSFGFFAIREYAVRPIVQRNWTGPENPHMHDLRATFLSGGAVGAVAAGFMRRPIVPGILTVAGLCTIVQVASNEATIGVRALMRKEAAAPPQPAAPPVDTAPEPDVGPERPSKPKGSIRAFIEKHNPIVPLSNDEYKERLLQRRAEIDGELILLEEALAQERKQLHTLQGTTL